MEAKLKSSKCPQLEPAKVLLYIAKGYLQIEAKQKISWVVISVPSHVDTAKVKFSPGAQQSWTKQEASH